MVWKKSNKGVVLYNTPVLFTPDSRLICSCAGNDVKVFSAQTGEEVSIFQDHKDEVTCIALNPTDSNQLYSGSKDSSIKLWDISKAILLATFSTESPLKFLKISTDGRYAYAVASEVSGTEQIIKVSLSREREEKPIVIAESPKFKGLALGSSGKLLLACGKKELWLYNFAANTVTKLAPEIPFVSCDIHPQEKLIAAGAKNGEIYIWYLPSDLLSTKELKKKIILWHTTPVRSIAFSPDGLNLLSGGDEQTLVIWHLESWRNQFLPQLEANFVGISISPDAVHYALLLDDNSIRIVDAYLRRIERTINCFKLDSLKKSKWQRPKAVIAPNNLMVTNNVTGYLQFFNVISDRFVFDVQVASLTDGLSRRKAVRKVTHFCFDKTGDHLVTIDEWADYVYLKFWYFNKKNKTYSVNTQVENPHNGEVTSLSFDPEKEIVVTTGVDGRFKVWITVPLRDNNTKTFNWVCRSVGTHKKITANCAAFSQDGSVLAVSFGPTLTFWSPLSNSLLVEFPHPADQTITLLSFIPGSAYLVTCSRTMIFVWHVIRKQLIWSYVARPAHLAVDNKGRFAIVNSGKDNSEDHIILFNASDPKPLQVFKAEGGVETITFISSESLNQLGSASNSALVYVTSDSKILVMEEFDVDSLIKVPVENKTIAPPPLDATKKGILEELYGTRNEVEIRSKDSNERAELQTTETALPQNQNRAISVLNSPSHILPSLSSLYKNFMDMLVIKEEQKGYDKPKVEEDKETKKVEEVVKDSKPKESRGIGLSNKALEDIEKYFQEATSSVPIKETNKTKKKSRSTFEENGTPQKKLKNQEVNGEDSLLNLDEVLNPNETKNTKKTKTPSNGKQKSPKSKVVDSQPANEEKNGSPTPSHSQRKRKLKNIESPKENGDQKS